MGIDQSSDSNKYGSLENTLKSILEEEKNPNDNVNTIMI